MSDLSQELQKEYSMRFNEISGYRNEVWKILIADYFESRLGSNKTILDLGCGWGEFINNVQAAEKHAMDLNPEARTKVAAGVNFLEQDCSATWQLPDNSLDVVFTSNFFEHLPSKSCLLDTLKQAHRCLKPGGKIVCMGPNIKYLPGDYWDFYDHHLALTHLSLVEGLRLADFQVAEAIPRFLPYTMADGTRPPLAAVRLYLKLPVAWRFFGKQFLVTAVKPG